MTDQTAYCTEKRTVSYAAAVPPALQAARLGVQNGVANWRKLPDGDREAANVAVEIFTKTRWIACCGVEIGECFAILPPASDLGNLLTESFNWEYIVVITWSSFLCQPLLGEYETYVAPVSNATLKCIT